MMKTLTTQAGPFYTKLAMILIILIAGGYLCILGKEVLSPLIFAMLIAIVLLPIASFLERRFKFHRSAAAGVSVVLMIVFVGLIFYMVGAQIADLGSDWPLFKLQLAASLKDFQHWISSTFHVNMAKQMAYVNSATSDLLTESTSVIGATVLSVSSMLLFLVFTMINTFFMLFYRRHIVRFLVVVCNEENAMVVYDIIAQVQYIIRKYIVGLLLEMAIVATVLCIVFWLLGIKYAMLLGIITGLFNIIPYIGIFTALLFSILVTFATAAGTTKILLVLVAVVIMHLIDSNVLLPMIVGSKVKINGLITLLGVIIGEMMWGVPGMFLSIPVIAIAKIVFDRVESLHPWGFLLGDEKDEQQPPPLKAEIAAETNTNPE
ncbi:AI-2E family transporter [Ferruginibacter sp.]|uniref:AI-2E family transporter n=1 Tax=Ferruginibacter sp. TaxID=1940288 RepID=UPI002658D443|nr:AI-2E family transporter [Ferruginibacter sp.]